MKKLFICLLTVASVAFVGCKKDKSSPSASMATKIDGVQWTAVNVGAVIQNGTINITGKAADSSVVTITLTDDIVDAYNIGLTNNEGALAYTNGGASSWTSNTMDALTGTSTCTVTFIDTANKTISGTFTCYTFNAIAPVASAMKVFTEGTFTNVTYTTTVVSTGTNTFAVKYDGTSLVPAIIFGTTSGGNIILTASDAGTAHSVGLTMPATATVGTHNIETIGGTYYGTFNNGSVYGVSNSGSGSIIVTSNNTTTKRIAGTFNFTTTSFSPVTTVALTNGAFDVSY